MPSKESASNGPFAPAFTPYFPMTSMYETDLLLNQYLLFHYGTAEDQLPYAFGPRDSLFFPQRCVSEFLPEIGRIERSLDLGCAVGRSTFELSCWSDEVLGIDSSRRFIQCAQSIQKTYRSRWPAAKITAISRGNRSSWRSPDFDFPLHLAGGIHAGCGMDGRDPRQSRPCEAIARGLDRRIEYRLQPSTDQRHAAADPRTRAKISVERSAGDSLEEKIPLAGNGTRRGNFTTETQLQAVAKWRIWLA